MSKEDKYKYGGHASKEAEAAYRKVAQCNGLVLEYYSEARVKLMWEVNKHHKLVDILSEDISAEWEIQLGHIAAFVGMPLDKTFNPAELDRLYVTLKERLQWERSPIILPNR